MTDIELQIRILRLIEEYVTEHKDVLVALGVMENAKLLILQDCSGAFEEREAAAMAAKGGKL